MHRNRLAVMVDGGFFLKRLRYQFPDADAGDPHAIADLIHAHALRHRNQKTGKDGHNRDVFENFDIYRIFYYDCPPFTKKMHYPVSGRSIDFAKSEQAVFRDSLHEALRRKRKVALRLGHLLDTSAWRIKQTPMMALLKGKKALVDLADTDFELDTHQKGVDMRLGLDVAALAYKQLVDQIVLIVGDSDFVPAAKLARREGIDVILDSLGQAVHSHLHEHTDGIRTPKVPIRPPRRRRAGGSSRGVVLPELGSEDGVGLADSDPLELPEGDLEDAGEV